MDGADQTLLAVLVSTEFLRRYVCVLVVVLEEGILVGLVDIKELDPILRNRHRNYYGL